MQYDTIRDDQGNVAAYLYNKSNKETPKPTAPEPKLIKQYESRTDAQKQKDNEASQAMANYKARINKNEQLKKQMEQKTKAMLDGSENPVETAKQLADSQKAIKSVYSDIKMQANAHENLLDVAKGLKKGTLGQAELNLFKKAIAKSPLIEYTETDAGEPAIMDINGKIAKIEDLDEGFLVNMLHVVKDRPWTLSLGLGATFLPWSKVDKIPGMNKVKKYGLQLAGFSGASSVGAAIDEKMRANRIDARKKDNVIYKSLMEAAVSNDTVEEAFGTISAAVTFNADKDVMEHTNELQQRMQTIGSTTNMMHAAKQEFIDSVAGTLILDGIIQGVSKGAKASAPYIKTGAKAVAKQLPSASAGVTTGGITTAGLTAIGVPMPVSIVGGGLVGAITRNKIKQGQDFVASGLNKVKSIGEEQLKNKGVNEVLDNARNQVNVVLNKKNTDPAYSIDGYLKQYYGEIANNPSALTSLNNKLGSLGISLNLNNNTDKALAVMLMSPNSPQFIKTMVSDSPAAGVAIRDMLTAFSVAFDNQIKNMLPVNNKQMSVATFASDLKTMQTNNIAALNELAKYGNKLTNNKVVSGVSANEYRDAIRNYADGKQLVNSGLPSKLSNRKKNIAAHKEDNQNLFTRFATLNDTEAKAVSEKGLLKGANFEDLVTMRANLAVIDDDAILAAPSIANLRIAIDQGLEEVLSNVSDSASRNALRDQMQQVVNKIHAFEKLGNNKLLNAIMKENNPDVILKHFTDMMQEIQILDNASAIKQVMSILPIQKRAQLETLIINKIIEDATDNLTTPGKLVINSAKLRGFIDKVEAQFATNEGKALLSILKDYAEVFGDSAALMKAATTKSTKTGPSGGIGHNLFNKFRVYMAGKLFRNLIGYLGPGHSSSTFRLANILAKRLRDPLDPNIAKSVDNLYNTRLAAYKNAKTSEAAATAKADIEAIKEVNNLASEVNAMSQKITANSTMIQDMEASLKQQNIDDAQVENIIGEQLGIPTKAAVETSDIQIIPIHAMKNLVNLNVNKLLQMEPELVKAMENDLYKRITSEAIEIAENLAVNNKQFNIKDFINTIIYRYNQVLPNNMQKYSLQEITEQDLKPIVDNTIALREEARKAYEIEKSAAYEAEQAELAAKQEAEAIANQEREAAEEAARQQRAQIEADAAAKREAENAEAKREAEKKARLENLQDIANNKLKNLPVDNKNASISLPKFSNSDINNSIEQALTEYNKHLYNAIKTQDYTTILNNGKNFMWFLNKSSDIVFTLPDSIYNTPNYKALIDTLDNIKLGDFSVSKKVNFVKDAMTKYDADTYYMTPYRKLFDIIPFNDADTFSKYGFKLDNTLVKQVETNNFNGIVDYISKRGLSNLNTNDILYIAKNVDDIANTLATKNIDSSKVFKDSTGKPIIFYRGAPHEDYIKYMTTRANRLHGGLRKGRKIDEWYNNQLAYQSNRIKDNSLFLSKDFFHAAIFTKNTTNGAIGAFTLNKDAKLLSLIETNKINSNTGRPVEFYSDESKLVDMRLAEIKTNKQWQQQYDKLINTIKNNKIDGLKLSDDTIIVFDKTALSDIHATNNNYITTHNFYSSAGGVLGIEQDDNGNYSIDPVKVALGMLLGYGAIKYTPILKDTATFAEYEPIFRKMLMLPSNNILPSKSLITSTAEVVKSQYDTRVKYFFAHPKERNITNERAELNKPLAQAKEMYNNGQDDKEILAATGWRYNEHLQEWQFKLPIQYEDDFYKQNGKAIEALRDNKVISLSELIPDAKLYKLYPQLNQVLVSLDDTLSRNTRGCYSKQNNMVGLNKDSIIKSGFGYIIKPEVLIHETQHAIQALDNIPNVPYLHIKGLADSLTNKHTRGLVTDLTSNINLLSVLKEKDIVGLDQFIALGNINNFKGKQYNNKYYTITYDKNIETPTIYLGSDDTLPFYDVHVVYGDSNLEKLHSYIVAAYYHTKANIYQLQHPEESLYNNPVYYITRPIEVEAREAARQQPIH